MAELVDATDLKSVIRKDVGVRVPPRAHIKLNLKLSKYLLTKLFESKLIFNLDYVTKVPEGGLEPPHPFE